MEVEKSIVKVTRLVETNGMKVKRERQCRKKKQRTQEKQWLASWQEGKDRVLYTLCQGSSYNEL